MCRFKRIYVLLIMGFVVGNVIFLECAFAHFGVTGMLASVAHLRSCGGFMVKDCKMMDSARSDLAGANERVIKTGRWDCNIPWYYCILNVRLVCLVALAHPSPSNTIGAPIPRRQVGGLMFVSL